MSVSLGVAAYRLPLGDDGPVLPRPDSATAVQTDATVNSRTIELTYSAVDPAPISYQIEQWVINSGWSVVTPDNESGAGPFVATFATLPDGLYRYRVSAVYAEGTSRPTVSGFVRAFNNKYFNYQTSYAIA